MDDYKIKKTEIDPITGEVTIEAVADSAAALASLGTNYAAGSVVYIPGVGAKVLSPSKVWG